jgi:hypothetical protein
MKGVDVSSAVFVSMTPILPQVLNGLPLGTNRISSHQVMLQPGMYLQELVHPFSVCFS